MPSEREFPAGAAEWSDGVSRREFVRLVGATIVAATGAACGGPRGEIVPYAIQPPEIVPGIPLHYATAMPLDGYAAGLVVESREGRPVKVEGNPLHPASLGAAGVFAQASVLQLYDPDRGRYIRHRGVDSSWTALAGAFSDRELRRVAGNDGAGLFFLVEPTASPVLLDQIDRISSQYPAASFHFYSPLATAFAVEGARLIFGEPLQPIYDLTQADVILAADADLLTSGAFSLRYARQFADGRRVRTRTDSMNRLYAIDGVMTPTGMAADHRLAARPSEVVGLLASLLDVVRQNVGMTANGGPAGEQVPGGNRHADWIRAVAADLVAHRGRAVVIAGDTQPAAAHALAHLINEALGVSGSASYFVRPVRRTGERDRTDLAALSNALRARAVRALVIVGGDPSYTAPAPLDFGSLVRRVPLSLYAGMYSAHTGQDAQWYAPLAHFLESWGDARALDGTTSIVQPLIAPLFGAHSDVELLACFAGDQRTGDDIVRGFWQDAARFGGDADAWRQTLRSGVVADSRIPPVALKPAAGDIAASLSREPAARPDAIELSLRGDASVHDGRFGNNAWLQELPDPIGKLTWDNAARISESTASRLGAATGTVLEIATENRRLQIPGLVVPGMADGVIALAFGYGQHAGGKTARDVGSNAFSLWAQADRFTQAAAATLAPLFGRPYSQPLAITQREPSDHDRPVLLEATLAQLQSDPSFAEAHRGSEPALYHATLDSSRQWGMAIDLTVCTGCSACMVACQAENNVPVVGKPGVLERREMHWLRIDRYVSGEPGRPQSSAQPMLCQHCEDAPCEYVCPVNATVHSPDGLNEMVYNRCVGTRFCSNNCPYKVRRFNWLNYTAQKSQTERMAMNPDVTVRDRGVMEKCTFCVQRIRRADIDAAETESDEPYTRLQTACQQACPTRAIVFGPISDSRGQVARDAAAPQSYEVLHELATRPRVHYLARLRNLNPALPAVVA
jgi:molybdopterin-containing oxidoreductase family iron-sulfur binding subunit